MGESFDEGLLVLNEMGDWKYVGGRLIPESWDRRGREWKEEYKVC